jgi:hypothetical protein
MPIIKIQTQVVGFLFDAQVWLEGQETRLSYDGVKTRQSTDLINVTDDKLSITFHGVGMPTSEWELTIVQLEPDERELYKRKGSIRSTGHSLIMHEIDIANGGGNDN